MNYRVGGNYTICAENLDRAAKTLTLDFNVINVAIGDSKKNQVEALDQGIRTLYYALSDVSLNIEKLRTRETVHYESIFTNNIGSDKDK